MANFNKVYITNDLLSEITADTVKNLKTAFSESKAISAVGEISVTIPAIPPDTEGDVITYPDLQEVPIVNNPYEKVDTYSGCPEFPQSATSANSGPNTITATDDNDNDMTLKDLSVQECMFQTLANMIIKKLKNDKKLVYYPYENDPSQSPEFKWFIQTVNIKDLTFNNETDYPYWYNDSGDTRNIYQLRNPITLNQYPADTVPIPVIAPFQLFKENTPEVETLPGLKKVTGISTAKYVEQYYKITIDADNVNPENIASCNILYSNLTDASEPVSQSCNDYYIDVEDSIYYLYVKLKVPDFTDAESPKDFDFSVRIQYFYY